MRLSCDRQLGFGIGPIPTISIMTYAQWYHVYDDFEDFDYIIRAMDTAFIKLNTKKSSVSKGPRKKHNKPSK